MLRVAVVGAGPSGTYAAEALTSSGPDVHVDVLDRLPTPFGLVRYGVAPDHLSIKAVTSALQTILTSPRVRFLGNVSVGRDVSLDELRRHYDAIVLAYGAAADRQLGVPGENLPGSVSATDFVAWYNGHPDAEPDRFVLDAESVAIIGVGNVAVDVARLLSKDVEALRTTDLPEHVVRALATSSVRDVHMIGRRGPAHATFTHKELRELGELAGVDVVVHPDELALDESEELVLATKPAHRRNVEVLRQWSLRTPTGAQRRLHLHFRQRPVEVLGATRVEGVRLERTASDGAGGAVSTAEFLNLPAQLLLRSVGYRGRPMPGLPFDEAGGVVPNVAGRVIDDGVASVHGGNAGSLGSVTGTYVVGWIKRGPTGLIGSNRRDAHETVASLLADARLLPRAPDQDPDAIVALLRTRGIAVVPWQGWCAIDAAEHRLGAEHSCDRRKIAGWDDLLAVAATAEQLPQAT